MATRQMEFVSNGTAEIPTKLYLDTDTADVHFLFESDCEDHIGVPAHKFILALGSPVFDAIFWGEIKEQGTTVRIADASRDGFKDFLRIFNQDKVMITSENVAEFINLSNKYAVPEGLRIGEQFLLEKTNMADWCSDLSLAVKFNLNKLREHCEQHIRENAAQVFKTEGFLNSSKEVFALILELGALNCMHEDIFNASIAWAENIAGSTAGKALRDELGECFYLIPFRTMPIDVFSNVLSANKTFFTVDEIADIMELILTGRNSETSSRFSENCILHKILKFNWDEGSLIKCTRDKLAVEKIRNKLILSAGIYSHEYTSFSVSKRMLLGGFRFLSFKSSKETLSATITVSKQYGAVCETLHDNIDFAVCPSQAQEQSLEIKLQKPIVIIPNMKYDIHVDFSSNELAVDEMDRRQAFAGCQWMPSLPSVVIDDNVCVSFHQHPDSEFASDWSIITEFYFNRL